MKKSNLKRAIVSLLCMALFLFCQKEETQPMMQSGKPQIEETDNKSIVLGQKLENPYAISVMKKAFENITTPSEGAKTNGRYALKNVIDEEGGTLELVDITENVVRVAPYSTIQI